MTKRLTAYAGAKNTSDWRRNRLSGAGAESPVQAWKNG